MTDAPRRYRVLVNAEGQHGLYPATKEPPDGWEASGFEGTEEECVRYVDEHWTDLRPRSVRAGEAG